MGRAVVFDVGLEHRVEFLVRGRDWSSRWSGRSSALGAWSRWCRDGSKLPGGHGAGVAVGAQLVDEGLGHILDDREPTGGVPVEVE